MTFVGRPLGELVSLQDNIPSESEQKALGQVAHKVEIGT